MERGRRATFIIKISSIYLSSVNNGQFEIVDANGVLQQVYPLVTDMSITQSIDPLTKTWSRAEASMSANNFPFKLNASTSALQRLSDIISSGMGCEITFYWSDAVSTYGINGLRFVGTNVTGFECTSESISVGWVNDADVVYDAVIPAYRVKDFDSSAPPDSLTSPVGVYYGNFTYAADRSGSGLIRGIPISADGSGYSRYIFADHDLNADTTIPFRVYVQDESGAADPDVVPLPEMYANAQVLGKIVTLLPPVTTGPTSQTNYYTPTSSGPPSGYGGGLYALTNTYPVINAANAVDANASTQATIRDNINVAPMIYGRGGFVLSNGNSNTIKTAMANAANDTVMASICYKNTTRLDSTVTATFRLYYNSASGVDSWIGDVPITTWGDTNEHETDSFPIKALPTTSGLDLVIAAQAEMIGGASLGSVTTHTINEIEVQVTAQPIIYPRFYYRSRHPNTGSGEYQWIIVSEASDTLPTGLEVGSSGDSLGYTPPVELNYYVDGVGDHFNPDYVVLLADSSHLFRSASDTAGGTNLIAIGEFVGIEYWRDDPDFSTRYHVYAESGGYNYNSDSSLSPVASGMTSGANTIDASYSSVGYIVDNLSTNGNNKYGCGTWKLHHVVDDYSTAYDNVAGFTYWWRTWKAAGRRVFMRLMFKNFQPVQTATTTTIHPTQLTTSNYSNLLAARTASAPTNDSYAYDSNTGTTCTVKNQISSSTNLQSEASWQFSGQKIADLAGSGTWNIRYHGCNTTWSPATVQGRIYFKDAAGNVQFHNFGNLTLNTGSYLTTSALTLPGITNTECAVALFFDHAGDATPSNTLNDQAMLNIGEVRLKIVETQNTSVAPVSPNYETVWLQCKGRNSLTDPARIATDIIGSYANVWGLDFTPALNSNIQSIVRITDNMPIRNCLQKLAEQSTWMFFSDHLGRPKIINLRSTASSSLTVRWEYVENGMIALTQIPASAKTLYINSRYRSEADRYMDYAAFGSGLPSYPYNWDWVQDSTSVSNLASYYVDGTTGLWSRQHVQVTFSVVGLSALSLQLGDRIQLDAVSIDPHLLCFGASWSGKYFWVTALTQKEFSTEITAIQLWT